MFTRLSLRAMLALVLAAGTAAAADAPPDSAKGPQSGPWKVGTVLALNLSQSSFSTNWASGDHSSVVWVLGTNATAERQFSPRFNWQNALTLAYGQTESQREDPAHPGRRVWDVPDKTTDQILFESTGRWTLHGLVDPYVALRAESQFADQSDPIGTLAFNPVKLKESAGVARVLEKTADAQTLTRLGLGLREAMGRTFTSASPRTTASYSTLDGGIEWQTDVKQPLMQKKVLYTGSLLVFEPLFYSRANALKDFDAAAIAAYPGRAAVADYWKTPNVNLQSTFAAQITRSLGVNLFAQWIYQKFDNATSVDGSQPLATRIASVDHGIRRGGQFKETLALAFSYRLF